MRRRTAVLVTATSASIPSECARMVLVCQPSSIWSAARAFIIAAIIATSAVMALCLLDKINEAMYYEIPNWAFVPTFLAIAVYPFASIIALYKRIPFARLAFPFAVGLGFGCVFTLFWTQIILGYGGLKMAVDGWVVLSAVTIALSACTGMLVWGLCRICRGRVLIQDGMICVICAYDLTGNVSGTCPECGTAT